ncbi:glycosyltransferase [Hufsiella arboris]|uniref:glycosyltransferase n=1 Tax=Hufsiella arboris TaxID=2695275 RepID=UPI0034E244DF
MSVIICARNEQNNLRENLPLILEQDYTSFEVVVVNDCSSDQSDQVLREFGEKYPHLKTVTIEEHDRFKHGKKFAVTIGIKAAKNELLVFTDADCRPVSANWLRQVQNNFNPETEIVLGFSPYERAKGFLNRLVRYETVLTALNYLSFALGGNAYMGVGRNMAYRKSLFFKGKGFASHMHILSGDDDLFVNQNATPTNTAIELSPESFVMSDPKKSWAAYWKQKLRHIGAGHAYKRSHKVLLGLQSASAIVFYFALLVLILLHAQWWFLAGLFTFRLGLQYFIYAPSFQKLKNKDLLWWLPLLDGLYYFFIFLISITTLFRPKTSWK